MLINKTNVLTVSLVAILGLSSHAFAGKGNGNGNSSGAASHSGMGDMSRTRSENTLRYKKQQGAKPQYQHQYKHTHQNAHQNTRINSVQGSPVNNFSAQQINE
jgi:hypothetical protein